MGDALCKKKEEEEDIEVEQEKKQEEAVQDLDNDEDFFNDLPEEKDEIVYLEHDPNKFDSVINTSSFLYNQRALQLINQIRVAPHRYANTIIDNIKYITTDYEDQLIFKHKVKVHLYKGEDAFREVATILTNTRPMRALISKEEIKIPLPKKQQEIHDSKAFIQKVNNMRQSHNINVYFKDYIKNPEVAILLMIVCDNKKDDPGKRNAILNPDFKYIGINSVFLDNKFLAQYSFSK